MHLSNRYASPPPRLCAPLASPDTVQKLYEQKAASTFDVPHETHIQDSKHGRRRVERAGGQGARAF